jgi:DNA-directed RNA polymerase specialized sigma24 family protein
MSEALSRQRLSALSDELLVERVRAGSPAAVDALFERYHLPLLAFCRHMLGRRDRAEGAVRDSFGQSLGAVRKHDRPVHLKALLFTIARNRSLAMLESSPARAGDGLELDGLDPLLRRDAELRALAGVVASLPPDQRAALLLAQLGRHTGEEIATIVGAPREKLAALVGQARMTVAGVEKPADWSCAQALSELAGNDGHPRRDAVRRHLADCRSCDAFPETIAHQRRLLAIVVPVTPSDRLSAPAPAAAPRRASVRASTSPPGRPERRRVTRTTVVAGAVGALLTGAAAVTLTPGQRGPAQPAALAPASHAGSGSGSGGAAGTDGGGGAGRASAPGVGGRADEAGGGPLTRASREAQRLVDGG